MTTMRKIRTLLTDAGLWQTGEAGRLGYLGATRLRTMEGHLRLIPACGVRRPKLHAEMLAALRGAGYDARPSGTGPGTSGELDIHIL